MCIGKEEQLDGWSASIQSLQGQNERIRRNTGCHGGAAGSEVILSKFLSQFAAIVDAQTCLRGQVPAAFTYVLDCDARSVLVDCDLSRGAEG